MSARAKNGGLQVRTEFEASQRTRTPPLSAREASWQRRDEGLWERYGQRRTRAVRMPLSARERVTTLPSPPSQYASVFSRRSRFALPRSGAASARMPTSFPPLSKFDATEGLDTARLDADAAAANDPEVFSTAASTRLQRTSQVLQPMRSPKKFSVDVYRKRKAAREGLHETGDAYWQGELAKKEFEKKKVEEVHDEHWKTNVEPWLAKRTKPRPTSNQRRLRAFRREQKRHEHKMIEQRKGWETAMRVLLKDVNFLLDHLNPANKKKGSAANFDQEAVIRYDENTTFLADMRQVVLLGQLTKHKVGEIEDFHERMVELLFMDADADGSGELERDEIKMLARMMGAKLSKAELDLAMKEMDGDGSGEVDFKEFYHWWKVKAKDSSLTKGTEGYSTFFDVVPHAEA